ncbi:DUF1801 domain-containing protein [Salmonirosea aquatica]|uniref:DUF1801 domain-containing protein n=1 Tax=Salmonirosea aquatica TaxID=2654236 RepID=A0A7C9FF35_9BACT|nr:DUF1801 domain-containing protein [Cytophagaceae bacterium SJW1-29]
MKKIDEYIASQNDWKRGILEELRKLIVSSNPEIKEDWKWNCPVWVLHKPICSANAFKSHVKLNFFQGAALEDKHGLFNAGLDSKHSRGIDFKEHDTIQETKLLELLHQAIELDSKS